jgi:hypothetical protein
MITAYKRAYTEVIEIIKYFPNEEYAKIPLEKINYYKENMDKDYNFKINPNIELEKQNISREANAILVTLFNDYFATDRQKEILNNLLKQNQQILEELKQEKYNPSNLFMQSKTQQQNTVTIQEDNSENSLIGIKENFFTKFINFIKNIFKR